VSDIIGELDSVRVINATGTVTRLGASRMDSAVIAAMGAAAGLSVDIADLQGRACEIIARATGAEAGIVTSGATASLLLGAAACIAGFDPAKMDKLPDTSGLPNEFVVAKSHRNSYDHGVRAAGARLVEVGLPDRVTACGVRDTEAWEIAAAIGERTAGVLYLAAHDSRPKLEEVVRVAHAANVPVLVDAAAQLPPASNLRRFVEEGADLVAFSGGKGIGGPSASGILCGKRRLIASALLQQLDLDYLYEDWSPPTNLIDKREFPGVPRHGVGRACKVGKEQIAGLLTALMRFAGIEDEARNRHYALIAEALVRSLPRAPALEVRTITDLTHAGMPLVEVKFSAPGPAAATVAARLREGRPRVHVDDTNADRGVLVLAPTSLMPEDAALVGAAFARAVGVSSRP
jgi:D-glucosaminate-6-phosphate ammonia-lyase